MTFVDKVRNDDPLGYYMAENMMLSETVGKMGARIETLEAALRYVVDGGCEHCVDDRLCKDLHPDDEDSWCVSCVCAKALEGSDEQS